MGFRTVLTAAVVIGGIFETAQSGARIVIDGPSNTLSAYFADGNLAWRGQTGAVLNGFFSFSDDLPATVQSSALLDGLLYLALGDLRLPNVPTFSIAMFASDGSATLNCANAANVGGSLLVAPTNTTFSRAAISGSVETWQTPALGAGWSAANIRSAMPLQYRIDAEDNLIVKGSVSCTSTTPAGTVFSVAAPYLPTGIYALQQGVMLKQSSAGAAFAFGHGFISAGAVGLNGFTFVVGDIVTFDFTWPIGHLP